MIGGLGNMMKQAQQLQETFQQMQEGLEATDYTGVSGGGLVSVTLNGRGRLRAVVIDPSLMRPEEAAVVQDLVAAAHEDAYGKMREAAREKTRAALGGMPLPPGFPTPF